MTGARDGGATAYGITALGAYLPRQRLARAAIAAAHRWMAPGLAGAAKGSRAFCAWDEDAITMAVEAARDGLRADPDRPPAALQFASTTSPYADLQPSALVASALDLPQALLTADLAGSQRAATSALIRALRAGRDDVLIVASDRPRAKPASPQEMSYGAGAAALRCGSGEPFARLLGAASRSVPFADHVRSADARHDYAWEERWIRDEGLAKIAPAAARAALVEAGLDVGDLHHLVLPSPLRGAGDVVARALGFKGKVAAGLDEGYAGVAQAFLMLGRVLEEAAAGERVLLVGFGQGADALVLEVTAPLPRPEGWRGVSGAVADRIVGEDYLRMLSAYGEIEVDWGMRGERSGKAALTEQYRSSEQVAAFKAGRCRACGTVQFPQLAYCVNPACAAPAAQFEPHRLVDEPCRILTCTADWLAFHPSPPLHVGFVQFASGARLVMETVDVGPSGLDVGAPLRTVFRIKERDAARGHNRYFWKTTPIHL